MADRTSSQLTREQMERGIERLRRRIADVEAFDPDTVTQRWSPEQKALEKSIDETLTRVFGLNSVDRSRYLSAADLDDGPIGMGQQPPIERVRGFIRAGKANSLAMLQQAVRGLEEDVADAPQEVTNPPVPSDQPLSRKVFVVHGHDEAPREKVARFLEQIGFEPIILHEQPNRGRTIIDKLESHGEVGCGGAPHA